jgi:hypothetical protein
VPPAVDRYLARQGLVSRTGRPSLIIWWSCRQPKDETVTAGHSVDFAWVDRCRSRILSSVIMPATKAVGWSRRLVCYGRVRCRVAITPAWSDGHSPVGVRSSSSSPSTSAATASTPRGWYST